MRILHAINSSDPKGGGPIEAIVQADRALSPLGHSNSIVCMDDPSASWLADLPVDVTALGPSISKYRYSPRYVPWLRENASAYDCVIVHGIWLHASSGVRSGLRSTDVPYFVYTHGMMDPTFRELFPARHMAKSVVWKMVEHKVMRDARAVFFTCEEEKQLAFDSFKPFACEHAIVPYCVGEPPGNPAAQEKAFESRFPDLANKRIILFLSRIHPKKGCDLLIDAFASVASEDPTFHLVIAGPDSVGWKSELEERAACLGVADRISWVGMLEGDLKWGAFRSAEVFALTSHQENFGIAVVEALACNLPVLITNKINIWREIEEDGAGLVGNADAKGACELLEAWARMSDSERMTMADRATACFSSRFRSQEAATNLLYTLRTCGVNHG